ncbi:MAG: signal peptidase II [Pseudomonadota bacterium]
MRLVFWSALAAFCADQLSKYIVVHAMNLKEVLAIDVLPPFLNFRMGWNTGINFGIMASDAPWMRWVLIAIALSIIAFVLWWIKTDPHGRGQKLSAGLLIGGALGNVFDRLVYGAVADFLNMSCCGFTNPTAFNVADIAVFMGAIGLVIFTTDKNKRQGDLGT